MNHTTIIFLKEGQKNKKVKRKEREKKKRGGS